MSRHRTPDPDRTRLPLAVFALTGMAVGQPILQLFGDQASFFIAHRLDRLDLLLFVLFPSLLLPAFLAGATVAARALGSRARKAACHLLFAMLAALLVLAALRASGDPFSGPWALALAAGLGLAADVAWQRSRPFANLVILLSAIAPIAAAVFVWQTAVAGLWDPPLDRATELETRSAILPPPARPATSFPIVWVVFDELPLASLLDGQARIDAELYPNFAALSATSTWFRNASTVWSHTERSIVSMLTGQIADTDRATTRAQYPNNLLSWLRASHTIRASEKVTQLGPVVGRSPSAPSPTRPARLLAVARDVGLVYAHRILPPVFATELPPVDGRWGHFASQGAAARGNASRALDVRDGRDRRFAAFLERLVPMHPPSFHFEHVMLPHLPSRFLPSRKVYGGRPVYRPAARAWLEDEQYAVEVYKRHLLQVGFVDRLVGDLIARLREMDLFDRSLLIVTSDHGASYWPGQDRRKPGATAHPDDILRIPLFVKTPGQATGTVRDDNVQTVDLAATVADLLTTELPWPTAGRSLREAGAARPAEKTLCGPRAGCTSMDAAWAPDLATLRRKAALFDPARGDDRWASQGRYRDLIGQPVSAFPRATPAPCVADLDQLQPLLSHDPSGSFAPAQWTGELHCRPALAAGSYLALATLGRLRATTALREIDGEMLFSVLFSDRALVAGDNEPAIYVIEGDPENVSLAPVSFLGLSDTSDQQADRG